MIRRTFFRAALAAACGLGLALPAQASEIAVHGSTTVANNIMLPHKADIEKQSGQTLKVVANGSSRGIFDLAAGSASMAMISAPLETTIKKVNKKKPGATDGLNLMAHRVGTTRVAFVVHPSNPVKTLTLAQIADVMSGKVKNWKDLGGKAAPILVVMETKGGGVRSMVEKEVMGGGDITAASRELPGATQVVGVVAQVPQAIGIAVQNTVNAKVAEVGTDRVIEQPLILVTAGQPTAEMAKVIEAARKFGG